MRGPTRDPIIESLEAEVPEVEASEPALAGRRVAAAEDRRVADRWGIKALMLAVLEDGISSYFAGDWRARFEAERWIYSSLRHWPFSFVVICETLGLEPDAVRAALRKMRAANSHLPPAIARLRLNVRRAHRRFLPGT